VQPGIPPSAVNNKKVAESGAASNTKVFFQPG
jgi:hypothetical protein